MIDSISQYIQMYKNEPELFTQSNEIPLILDEEQIRRYTKETGKEMGLVFDNSPFFRVVADLCEGTNGYFRYARVIPMEWDQCGAAALPILLAPQGRYFGIIKIYRHSCRSVRFEIPRGFREQNDTSLFDTVTRELQEEIGASVLSLDYLGEVQVDSGLSAGIAKLFAAKINPEQINIDDHEGITGFEWIPESEFRLLLGTKIVDGFTLGAYALLCARNGVD